MEMISKAIVGAEMEKIVEMEKAQAQSAPQNGGANRHERRALAKLARKDEMLARKIRQLESTVNNEE